MEARLTDRLAFGWSVDQRADTLAVTLVKQHPLVTALALIRRSHFDAFSVFRTGILSTFVIIWRRKQNWFVLINILFCN